jgi:predicted lipid-binding transport protein (Tim44 family)
MLSGFFFGLFGGMTLFLYGVIPLHSSMLWILPLVGVVLGLAMAAWAPFGSGPQPQAATTSGIGYAPAGDAAGSPASGTTLEQEPVPNDEQDPADRPGGDDSATGD